jgi:hypothetical protein
MCLARQQIGSQLHWIMVELRENDAQELAKARQASGGLSPELAGQLDQRLSDAEKKIAEMVKEFSPEVCEKCVEAQNAAISGQSPVVELLAERKRKLNISEPLTFRAMFVVGLVPLSTAQSCVTIGRYPSPSLGKSTGSSRKKCSSTRKARHRRRTDN